MNKLQLLAMNRIAGLGQEAFNIFQDLAIWRENPLTPSEKANIFDNYKKANSEQYQWIEAIIENE